MTNTEGTMTLAEQDVIDNLCRAVRAADRSGQVILAGILCSEDNASRVWELMRVSGRMVAWALDELGVGALA